MLNFSKSLTRLNCAQCSTLILLLPLLLLLVLLQACSEKPPVNTRLSEKPEASAASVTLQPRISDLGMRLRIGFDELNQLARTAVPETQQDEGSKKFCKRVIGIKLCGRARWVYTVNRTGDITVGAAADKVAIGVPMEFFGNAGIKGDLAKALGLRKLDFSGALDLVLKLNIDLTPNWCPVIKTEVEYEWTRTPKVEWVAGLDFNIKDILDKNLSKQLESLDERIAESINCAEFRASLQEQWRSYSFPVDLPQVEQGDSGTLASDEQTAQESGINQLFLNVEPRGFAFSGVNTETDRLGVSFILRALASVQPDAIEEVTEPLPALEKVDYAPGKTEFDLLVKLDYGQLQALATESVVGKTFSSSTAAGPVDVDIKGVEVYATDDRLTLGLQFDSKLPGVSGNTAGTVYLTARPLVDSDSRQVSLTDIQFAKIIDSTLWSVVATVFEQRIVAELQERAVIDLNPRITELEVSLLAQLSDPEKTRGAVIDARDLAIDLVELVPEKEALAAVLRVSSLFDIDLPMSVFEQAGQ